MRVEFHPAVRHDVAQASRYYRSISESLGEAFAAQLRRAVKLAASNPRRHPPAGSGFRRAGLEGFPYHFLYREIKGGIRITLVRHHRRHSNYGMERR